MFPIRGVVIGTVRLYSTACDLSLHIKCEMLAEAGTQRENSRWGSGQLSNSGDFAYAVSWNLRREAASQEPALFLIVLSRKGVRAHEPLSGTAVVLGLILNDRILKSRAPSVGTYSYNLGLREYSQSQMLICICLEVMGCVWQGGTQVKPDWSTHVDSWQCMQLCPGCLPLSLSIFQYLCPKMLAGP